MSSPKHEQGNAMAEAFVKKIKRLFEGSRDEDELVAAFLAMNQTPMGVGRPSPAEVHLGRNVRDEMHGKISQAQVDWEEVKLWKEEKQMTDKTLYDRGACDLPELKPGHRVRVWHNESWKKGRVKEKNKDRPRSYQVELDEGQCIERNRVKIGTAVVDEQAANERKVSPMLTFSQALPLQEVAHRSWWAVMISTKNTPGLSPDNEGNLEESTAREDSGTSTLPNVRPPVPPSRPRRRPCRDGVVCADDARSPLVLHCSDARKPSRPAVVGFSSLFSGVVSKPSWPALVASLSMSHSSDARSECRDTQAGLGTCGELECVCVRYGVLERSCSESENEYGSCHLALERAGSLLPLPSHILKVKRVATVNSAHRQADEQQGPHLLHSLDYKRPEVVHAHVVEGVRPRQEAVLVQGSLRVLDGNRRSFPAVLALVSDILHG